MDFDDKKGEHRHCEANTAQKVESVQVSHGSGLPQNTAIEQPSGAGRWQSKAVGVYSEVGTNLHLPGTNVGRRQVLDKSKLVKLRTPGEHGCDRGDSEA